MEIKEPYYAVIFTNSHTQNTEGYGEMANEMVRLAKMQEGFIDFETARDTVGISVSYWKTLADIANWKNHVEHSLAQKKEFKIGIVGIKSESVKWKGSMLLIEMISKLFKNLFWIFFFV